VVALAIEFLYALDRLNVSPENVLLSDPAILVGAEGDAKDAGAGPV